MIQNITPYVDFNQQLKRTNTQLTELTYQNSLVSKDGNVEPTNKKARHKLWGLVQKQPNVPSLPVVFLLVIDGTVAMGDPGRGEQI